MRIARSVLAGMVVVACLGAGIGGCESTRRAELENPAIVAAPYGGEGNPLWAVVPLANESGTSVAGAESLSDQLVAAVSEVSGVRCLPLNRTLAAMQALDMPVVQSPGDARRLAQAMGVDGLIVGTVTAYDPYDPPAIGLNLALFARGASMGEPVRTGLDPRTLAASATDAGFERSSFQEQPVATYAEHLDAKNHAVLASVQSYARGRHNPEAALGWRRYVSSMPLYCEFATHHAVAGLMEAETRRVGPSGDDRVAQGGGAGGV